MTNEPLSISSTANRRIKELVKLRQRSHRDELGLMLIEGYREIKRALHNKHLPLDLFFCSDLFQGKNNMELVNECKQAGAELMSCSASVFHKISYRDRPDGLLATAPQVRLSLSDLNVPACPFIVVAESIEKPGNLGTILRSADATGVHAVIVCDKCTDINNPNVVRASIGTIFSIPVIETSSTEALQWLKERRIRTIAATPHASMIYTEADFSTGSAIVLGTEQYGLSEKWLDESSLQVRIPMLGQSDSLNVASSATILLYEAARQRGWRPS